VESNSDFDREYDLLKEQLDRADELRKSFQSANSNSSTININLGLNGWVAGVCMALFFTLAFLLFEVRQEIREHQYQFNALYSRYPYLRPENTDARHTNNP
jgi:hypothetical protein